MYDNSLKFAALAETKTNVLSKLQLTTNNYILCTIHRDNNTDNANRLNELFETLNEISTEENIPVVLPVHPRTSKLLAQQLTANLFHDIKSNQLLKIIPPVSFLEMIALEKNAKLVMTDSGGVQKEAFFFQKPCIILRTETEWVELVECGTAIIADANKKKIKEAYKHFNSGMYNK